MGIRDDGYFKSINTAKLWYKNDPFILTTQATKVFYLPDTNLRGDWRVVQRFQHRHLWSVAEDIEKAPGDGGLSYQDEDDSTAVPVRPSEGNVPTRLQRGQARVLVDAAVVEGIKKRRKEVVHGEEKEDGEENETDHTMFQYCSDDEENRTVHQVPHFDIDDDE
jgi:hypothetical protein